MSICAISLHIDPSRAPRRAAAAAIDAWPRRLDVLDLIPVPRLHDGQFTEFHVQSGRECASAGRPRVVVRAVAVVVAAGSPVQAAATRSDGDPPNSMQRCAPARVLPCSCDTFVVVKEGGGGTLLGKNSDRPAADCQVRCTACRFPLPPLG